MDDLTALLDQATDPPRSPVEGSLIRRRADRRRRTRTALLAGLVALVALAVAVPSLSTLEVRRGRVLLDQGPTTIPTPPPTPAPPTPPAPTYGRRLDVAATVVGPLAGQVHVSALSAEEAAEGGVHAVQGAGVVITSQVALHVALGEAAADRPVEAVVSRIEGTEVVVDRGASVVQAGVPTVVLLAPPGEDVVTDGISATVQVREPRTVSIPIGIDDTSSQGAIEVEFVPRPVVAADLGVAEPVDVPDQPLPRPGPGEALPEQLADGTPVWVVGLDEGEVAVVDARSPHGVSGLVGWCGTLPGFTDSPGASRFNSRGAYGFGPAPTGLTPYAIDVEGDTVMVLARLAPPPRPDQDAGEETSGLPPIREGDLPQGQMCESAAARAQAEGRDGVFDEDYTAAPGWVQHDLGNWPTFDGQADGWYRTGTAVLDGARQQGDMLIRREDGRTVDLAGPPGSVRYVGLDGPPDPRVALFLGLHSGPTDDCPDCVAGEVDLLEVSVVTPDGIVAPDPAGLPPGPLSLIGQLPYNVTGEGYEEPQPPPAGSDIAAVPGQLVVVRHNAMSAITSVTPLD